MSRRIKYFGGQHATRPIKSKRQLDELFGSLLNRVERARTPVKQYQAERNYMLVLMGVNTAFRAEDLLQLRVVDVVKGYFSIRENKTGKMQNFRMNKALHETVLSYIDKWELKPYDYLFRGQMREFNGKRYVYPITRQQGHAIVSSAGLAIGIDYTFGLHSLRKTFGYHYILGGGKVLTLMKMFNHDDPEVTLRYICWGTDDAERDREAFFLGPKGRGKSPPKDRV